jgi:hypothetical protein
VLLQNEGIPEVYASKRRSSHKLPDGTRSPRVDFFFTHRSVRITSDVMHAEPRFKMRFSPKLEAHEIDKIRERWAHKLVTHD